MTKELQPRSARSQVKLQLDGRPFSLARTTPTAIVSRQAIDALIEPLRPEPKNRMILLQGIASILQEYLGVMLTNETKADNAASRKALARISRLSANLAQQIVMLPSELLLAMEENRFNPKGKDDSPKFDFLQLEQTLKRLERSASRTRASARPRRRGAPTKKELDRAVRRFWSLSERLDLPVVFGESGSKEVRRSLGGAGGL